VRNHHDGGWISATWTHLRSAPVPFGDLAWDHARQILAERGGDPATEAEITAAATALLNRAEHGPETTPEQPTPPKQPQKKRRSRRVAGRTKATNAPAWPQPDPDGLAEPASGGPGTEHLTEHLTEDVQEEQRAGEHLAKVIPLGVFDPFEEATKRW
jgi:putative transposase